MGVTEVRNLGLDGPGELFSFGENSRRQILCFTYARRAFCTQAIRGNRSAIEPQPFEGGRQVVHTGTRCRAFAAQLGGAADEAPWVSRLDASSAPRP